MQLKSFLAKSWITVLLFQNSFIYSESNPETALAPKCHKSIIKHISNSLDASQAGTDLRQHGCLKVAGRGWKAGVRSSKWQTQEQSSREQEMGLRSGNYALTSATLMGEAEGEAATETPGSHYYAEACLESPAGAGPNRGFCSVPQAMEILVVANAITFGLISVVSKALWKLRLHKIPERLQQLALSQGKLLCDPKNCVTAFPTLWPSRRRGSISLQVWEPLP